MSSNYVYPNNSEENASQGNQNEIFLMAPGKAKRCCADRKTWIQVHGKEFPDSNLKNDVFP
tara:strand:- start:160 stop:342 length:183 start_codon:yes stop_codon:yes gene_type:complete